MSGNFAIKGGGGRPPNGKCHLKFPFWFFDSVPNEVALILILAWSTATKWPLLKSTPGICNMSLGAISCPRARSDSMLTSGNKCSGHQSSVGKICFVFDSSKSWESQLEMLGKWYQKIIGFTQNTHQTYSCASEKGKTFAWSALHWLFNSNNTPTSEFSVQKMQTTTHEKVRTAFNLQAQDTELQNTDQNVSVKIWNYDLAWLSWSTWCFLLEVFKGTGTRIWI